MKGVNMVKVKTGALWKKEIPKTAHTIPNLEDGKYYVLQDIITFSSAVYKFEELELTE